MPADCQSFSARRFLSIADPRSPEAGVFNYAGRSACSAASASRCSCSSVPERIRLPPARRMGLILKAKTRSVRLDYELDAGR
jgi:hypothetical protein